MEEYTFFASELAIKKLKDSLVKRGTPDGYIRVGVRGGLCEGNSYDISFYDGERNERDLMFEFDSLKILVDKKSILYLNGAEIGWRNSLMTQGYFISNPLEKSSCGCGKSFSV